MLKHQPAKTIPFEVVARKMSRNAWTQSFLAVLVIVACLSGVSNGTYIDIENGLFVVNTTIYDETLHVTIVAVTTGYVGFGVSPGGRMAGSDVVLAGYDAMTQTTYIGDYFINFQPPAERDSIQNVALVAASENGTHTFVSFNRPLDSGDTVEDLPIENQTQFFIWAIGSDDNLMERHMSRGAVEVNLFDEP